MWLPGQTLQIIVDQQKNFGKISRDKKNYEHEPTSKPKDDICRVCGPIFAIIYMSLGFEAPGVRILLLIVQHSPIRQSVIYARNGKII